MMVRIIGSMGTPLAVAGHRTALYNAGDGLAAHAHSMRDHKGKTRARARREDEEDEEEDEKENEEKNEDREVIAA